MKNKTGNLASDIDTQSLLDELQLRIQTAQRQAVLTERAANFSPIEEVGQRIRAERKRQKLTLKNLCDLSGVAYATLNKIEQGHPSARLDSITGVASALGMQLWIG